MSERRTRVCDCGAVIVFLPTKAGKSMPVNADTVNLKEDKLYDAVKHVSHYATCPQAAEFRKETATWSVWPPRSTR